MKWVSYGWSVTKGVVKVGVAFFLVTKFASSFERAVIDLLILTYAAVDFAAVGRGLLGIQEAKLYRTRHFDVMKAVGSNLYESEDAKAMVARDDELVGRTTVNLYIKSGFVSLAALIAFVNLLYL